MPDRTVARQPAKPIEFRIFESRNTYVPNSKPWFTWEMWRGRTLIAEGYKSYRSEKACIKFVQELGETFQDTGFTIAPTKRA